MVTENGESGQLRFMQNRFQINLIIFNKLTDIVKNWLEMRLSHLGNALAEF